MMKQWMKSDTGRGLLAVAVFAMALYFIVVTDLAGLARMPGDWGDSRLNNIFLENVWQVLIGRSDSFIHLPFFWPFPYVVGFSDNLWGSSPFYVIWRFLGRNPMKSFQLWYYLGFAFNFFAMHWVLRKLGFSLAASLAASVFYAFCLPGLAQAGHVQLQYRFAVPPAVYFFVKWLQEADVKACVAAALWTTWQFWMGMYMGIFLLLLLLCITVVALIQKARRKTLRSWLNAAWQSAKARSAVALTGGSVALLLMGVLLYPYAMVSWLYGGHRSWGEISLMLPRLTSYFLMDSSSWYGNWSQQLGSELSLRWEHQIFIGVVPLLMVVIGVLSLITKKNIVSGGG